MLIMIEKGQGIRNIKTTKDFNCEEREEIVKDYLTSGLSKREIWEKYSGQPVERGHILNWIRVLGYEDPYSKRTMKYISMDDEKSDYDPHFESIKLRKRIAELEKELEESRMKAIAFSTMVDMAEKEFNISIRKKYSTKRSEQ